MPTGSAATASTVTCVRFISAGMVCAESCSWRGSWPLCIWRAEASLSRGYKPPTPPGVRLWLWNRRDRLVTMACLFAQLAVVLPASRTHECPYPLRWLLATLRRAFQCFACLAHQLPRDLAHHFWFRLVVDANGELQRVPSVLFAITASGAGSEIHPSLFPEPDTGGPFPAPGREPHAVLFRRQDGFYLVAFVVPGCQLRRGKVKPEMRAIRVLPALIYRWLR